MEKKYLFETLLFYNGVSFELEKHIDRILLSLKEKYNIEIDKNKLIEESLSFITKQTYIKNQKYRFNIFIDIEKNIYFKITKYNKKNINRLLLFNNPIRKTSVKYYKDENYHHLFDKMKFLLKREIQDIIILNEKKQICECLKSNIVFFDNENIIVPEKESGYFSGITLESFLLDNKNSAKKILYKKIYSEDIKKFNSCFILSSLIEKIEIDSIIDIHNNVLWKSMH